MQIIIFPKRIKTVLKTIVNFKKIVSHFEDNCAPIILFIMRELQFLTRPRFADKLNTKKYALKT